MKKKKIVFIPSKKQVERVTFDCSGVEDELLELDI